MILEEYSESPDTRKFDGRSGGPCGTHSVEPILMTNRASPMNSVAASELTKKRRREGNEYLRVDI